MPRSPGIPCAMGLLLADLRADFAATRLMTLAAAALPGVGAAFAELQARADAWFDGEGIAPEARQVARTVDMRYAGQNHELAVTVPDGPAATATLDALASGFASLHRRTYGFVAEGEAVQLVTFRVEAVGVVRKARFQPQDDGGPDASAAAVRTRQVPALPLDAADGRAD